MWPPPLHQTDQAERFIQIAPSLAGNDEVFEVIVQLQAFASFPLCSSMKSEKRPLNLLDGIADAAPESASIEWTLALNRTSDVDPGIRRTA